MELPPCVTCGHRASGIHYGVMSCDACKTFFRRNHSLSSPQEFVCDKGGKCDVTCKPRSCRACRMKKCLSMGMSDTAIKLGRYSHSQRVEVQIETKNFREEQRPPTCKQSSTAAFTIDQPVHLHKSEESSVTNYANFSKGQIYEQNGDYKCSTKGVCCTNVHAMHLVQTEGNHEMNTCIEGYDTKGNGEVVLDPGTGEFNNLADVEKSAENSTKADDMEHVHVCGHQSHYERESLNHIHNLPGKEEESRNQSIDTDLKSPITNIDDTFVCPNGIHNFSCLDDMKCRYGFLTCSLLNLDHFLESDVANNEMDDASMENLDMSSALNNLVSAMEKFCPFQHLDSASKVSSNAVENEEMEPMEECLCEELPPFSNDEYFALLEVIGIDVDGRGKQIGDHMIQYKSLNDHYKNFARKIPGFLKLPKDDQLVLLNSARLDFFLLVMHQAFDPEDQVILGFSGDKYPIPEHSNLMPQNLMKVWIEVMTKVKQLTLTPQEMSVVYALVLTATDRCKLKELSKVKILHDVLKNTLENMSVSNNVCSPRERCLQIHLMLSELRQLTNMICAEHSYP